MKPSVWLALFGMFWAGCTADFASEGTSPAGGAPRAASASSETGAANPVDPGFGNYWYQGQAELTSYVLEQARYGEMRSGRAVLIFVTEDFSASKQVKLDNPARADANPVKVLKLNLTKQFNTGIYPYSMMTSVFTPIYGREHPHTLKVTTSSQEWCGHTFTQFNLKGDTYHIQHHSYFESEGEQALDLDRVLLEDEIWNRIRIDPATLPTGDIRIIAGTMYQRLAHTPFQVEAARASLEAAGVEVMTYTLTYPAQNRTLSIRFRKAFPHEIEGWEDTHTSGFGDNVRRLTTRATRDRSMMLDYWNRNRTVDDTLRAALNLD